MRRSSKTGKVGVIITIIILTILVIITNIDTSKFSFMEGITNKVVMPIQKGLTYLKNKIAGNETFFKDINNLEDENEQLKQELKYYKAMIHTDTSKR